MLIADMDGDIDMATQSRQLLIRGNIEIMIECPLCYLLLPGIDPHFGLWHNGTLCSCSGATTRPNFRLRPGYYPIPY